MPSFTRRFSDKYPLVVSIVTWLMRLLVGGLFIFSGFTKGIDIWGTIYKFNEYFSAWGYEAWEPLILVGVFLLCLAEFLVGFFIIFGCMRKAAPIVALLIMAFMLPLTLWLAIANPISDCGCFGDAVKLSNWATFFKNIVITAGALWLVAYNRTAPCLIHPYLQWIATLAAGAYILAVSWIGYYYQPLIDFRPYKTGSELITADDNEGGQEADDEDSYLRFVYEKDGRQYEFGIDDELPDEEDGWTFVERRYDIPEDRSDNVAQPDFSKHPEKNIRFFTEDGIEDVTEDVIGNGRQLILMIPKLSEVSAAKTWKINSFYEWCRANDVEMLAAVGGNPAEIRQWKDISLAAYPIYTSDDTSIEEVVRGNPGIVYLEDGIIKWKSSLKAINIDDFQRPDITSNPMNFARDNARILRNLSWIFLGVTAALISLSLFPHIVIRFFTRKSRRRKMDSGKSMPAEWENPDRILLTLPSANTDWNYILPEALDQFDRLIDKLLEGGEKVTLIVAQDAPSNLLDKYRAMGVEIISDIDFNDTWTRDYGPITVDCGNELLELDFGFNGWGLKFEADKDNLVNLNMVEKGYRPKERYRDNRDYTLEGGSIESDGLGTILTTSRCLCSPNRNGGKKKAEVEKILATRLGARRVLWLDYGFLEGDDTDSHIDTLARIAPDNTIVYVAPPKDKKDVHYKELKNMERQLKAFRTEEGKPYRLISLPFPEPIFDEEGCRLPATYANYLVTGSSVYMPVYGQPENDREAVEKIKLVFPDHKVYTVECLTLIKQHGSLHCSTMQLY